MLDRRAISARLRDLAGRALHGRGVQPDRVMFAEPETQKLEISIHSAARSKKNRDEALVCF
jgi:hypothetical protein